MLLTWFPELMLWTVGFAAAVCALHYLFWKAFRPEFDDRQREAANWGAIRIGAVHAFILALVFSEVRQEHNELAETIDNEALAIEQLYRGLDGIDAELARTAQENIEIYTRMVIDEEWPSLAKGRPLERADRIVDEVRLNVIAISASEGSGGLSSALLDDINDIENARGQRSFDISEPVSALFWLIAATGFVFTAACYFVHAPSPLKSSVLAMFSAINGLVFFAIISFTTPFHGAVKVEPKALRAVLTRTIDGQ